VRLSAVRNTIRQSLHSNATYCHNPYSLLALITAADNAGARNVSALLSGGGGGALYGNFSVKVALKKPTSTYFKFHLSNAVVSLAVYIYIYIYIYI
jgi:hypothetical protein